jgi:8-oxo-dGTP diphosphatase
VIDRPLTASDFPAFVRGAVEHGWKYVSGRYRWTAGVTAVIRNEAGAVLVARTAYPPRRWNLPGGRVERGERPQAALVREILEETGLQVRVGRLLVVQQLIRDNVTLVFGCERLSGELRPAPAEIRALAWCPADRIDRLPEPLGATVRDALRADAEGTVRYRS